MLAHTALRLITPEARRPTSEGLIALQTRYFELLERDLENAETGLYPKSLLFQFPIAKHAWNLPRFLADIPRSYFRARERKHDDLPKDVDRERYPAYFRRTFHWQTDGYLSRHSAEVYDVSVEFVFLGCADVMRRQVIPPMTRFTKHRSGRTPRILDVACGTGRSLAQIATALPGHQYFGIDMSPFYIEEARKTLADVPETTLLAENAEAIPFKDEYFDIVTSTYLLHELPRKARRNAVGEMLRVLRPGGLLVIEDSAQLVESPELQLLLEDFPAQMHEPFYADYVKDDIEKILAGLDMAETSTERCWLSKVVHGIKP